MDFTVHISYYVIRGGMFMILIFYTLKVTIVLLYVRLIVCYIKAKKLDPTIRCDFNLFQLIELFTVLGVAISCVLSVHDESFEMILIIVSILVCIIVYFESRRIIFIGDTYVILRLLPKLVKKVQTLDTSLNAIIIKGSDFSVKIAAPLIKSELFNEKLYNEVQRRKKKDKVKKGTR